MTILTDPTLFVSDLKPIEAVLKRTSLDPTLATPLVSVVDLTGATVTWLFGDVEVAATIEDAEAGHISYTFTSGSDALTPGEYLIYIRAVLSNGEDFVTYAGKLKVLSDPFER